MDLSTDIADFKGIGPTLKARFNAIRINTIGDLINYFPRRYDDYSVIDKISALNPGLVSVKAKISDIKQMRARRGLHITEATAEDESGKVRIVWFNQPYRANSINSGKTYYLRGEYKFQSGRIQIINPGIELADHDEIAKHRILPIYRESAEINSTLIRKVILQAIPYINTIEEILPEWLIKKYGLMGHSESLRAIHFPSDAIELSLAKQRLGFEELFILILASQLLREKVKCVKSIRIPFKQQSAIKFVQHLPFKLTDDQRRAVWQIYKDIDSEEPMNRLIEGDVGSGKTVVAAMASLMVAEAGLQTAFIAPTELLARQHAVTVEKLLSHSSLSKKVALLTGSTPIKMKQEIYKQLKANKISILIGTHALFEEKVDWHKLGMIIIDEQHRFGVKQRQKLLDKAGHMPHILLLTATPIPRSLALTIFGELDITLLEHSPKSRAGVETSIVSPNSSQEMFNQIYKQLDSGRQAYIVCPLISESDTLQISSAEKLYKELSQKELKNYKVGLLHGKLKPSEKDKIMQDFVKGNVDVLVSTTVIEVGVDVPNATVMAIYSADRFGLAQLHQLRGRVGRGAHKGICYLIMSTSAEPSKRLVAASQVSDGFELAEMDLKIRGPGAIYGVRQHGILDLKIAEITDTKLISKARAAVNDFRKSNEKMINYKQIEEKVKKASKLTYLN